jgi:LDH2 family malate/lactate/ureidoglycolate dehydrogenase
MNPPNTVDYNSRFRAKDLIGFGEMLLIKSGLPEDRAKCVAETLVEGDLMGHRTHGLALGSES